MIDYDKIFPDLRLKELDPLKQTQIILYRILQIIDDICKRNKIDYWIDSGTLLGAVRHKDFIPWDDDLDICMPRKSYEKFIKIAQQELPYDLFLETKKTDKERPLHFIKVRDRFSSINHISGKTVKWLNSIYVDVFPVDLFSESFKKTSKIIYKLQYKGFKSKNPLKIMYSFFTFFLKFTGIFKFITVILNFGNKKYYSYAISFQRWWPQFHKIDDVYPLKPILFKDNFFLAPNNPDIYLREYYGDYMQLPPLEERKPLHSLDVDVTKPYPHKESLNWHTDERKNYAKNTTR